MAECTRCGLPVSPGICAPLPHVFHDKPEHCIAAVIADADTLRAQLAAQAKLLGECADALALMSACDDGTMAERWPDLARRVREAT